MLLRCSPRVICRHQPHCHSELPTRAAGGFREKTSFRKVLVRHILGIHCLRSAANNLPRVDIPHDLPDLVARKQRPCHSSVALGRSFTSLRYVQDDIIVLDLSSRRPRPSLVIPPLVTPTPLVILSKAKDLPRADSPHSESQVNGTPSGFFGSGVVTNDAQTQAICARHPPIEPAT